MNKGDTPCISALWDNTRRKFTTILLQCRRLLLARAKLSAFGQLRNNARSARLPLWVDAVEKVGPSIGINALGIFDPAETGRRFGFTAA
jgi:hypothetical protein